MKPAPFDIVNYRDGQRFVVARIHLDPAEAAELNRSLSSTLWRFWPVKT